MTRHGEAHSELILRLPGTVWNERGGFTASVIAREIQGDAWEGLLEFIAVGTKAPLSVTTGIETRQRDLLALERWASGVTAVYAEGALSRALAHDAGTPQSDLLAALEEIVDAIDRRLPHVERASESAIAEDARRLRAAAAERIEALRKLRHARG
jgi:hypothetical protein